MHWYGKIMNQIKLIDLVENNYTLKNGRVNIHGVGSMPLEDLSKHVEQHIKNILQLIQKKRYASAQTEMYSRYSALPKYLEALVSLSEKGKI